MIDRIESVLKRGAAGELKCVCDTRFWFQKFSIDKVIENDGYVNILFYFRKEVYCQGVGIIELKCCSVTTLRVHEIEGLSDDKLLEKILMDVSYDMTAFSIVTATPI